MWGVEGWRGGVGVWGVGGVEGLYFMAALGIGGNVCMAVSGRKFQWNMGHKCFEMQEEVYQVYKLAGAFSLINSNKKLK